MTTDTSQFSSPINNNTNTSETSSPIKNNSRKRSIPCDIRIAVIGNVDSGKSTMIGVLTSGDLDNGRGSARIRILRHSHERDNGRTSCSSQHILGFSGKHKPVHQPVSISAAPKQKTAAWSQVFNNSNKIITFIDLAGHEKYLKTTISGLTGCFPDYAFIVVGANMGISKMTREHIQVAVALSVPLFVVITKIDIAPEKVLKHTVKTLVKLLRSSTCNNKMAMIIRKKKEIKLVLEKDQYLERICPIFCVSAVKGDNIEKLNYFLSHLHPRQPWKHKRENYVTIKNGKIHHTITDDTIKKTDINIEDMMHGELEIDETFAVRGVGIVVSGTVTAGRIFSNQKLYLGPFSDSSFKEIIVRSVHMKRCIVDDAREGESCSLSFRFVKRKEVVDRIMIRKGMVAVSDEDSKPKPVWAFTATILVLHHPTTINEGYQPVVHCGNIRQTATIMKMSRHRLRSGDSSLVDMKFLCHPEFLHTNRAIIIREGSTKCIGRVIQLYLQYHPSLSDFGSIERQLGMHSSGQLMRDERKECEMNCLEMKNNVSNKSGNSNVNDGSIVGGGGTYFDEHRITKEDLHRLEEEMEELKLKRKQKKLQKRRMKQMQISGNITSDGKTNENIDNNVGSSEIRNETRNANEITSKNDQNCLSDVD